MPNNNAINAFTRSSGWTSFTTTITATANPTLGAGSTITSYYLQFGKLLYLMMRFNNVSITGATAGTGIYSFNLPSGFSINSSIAKTNPYSVLGSTKAWQPSTPSNQGIGVAAVIADFTHYSILMYNTSAALCNFISDSWYSVANPVLYTYSAELCIPIN